MVSGRAEDLLGAEVCFGALRVPFRDLEGLLEGFRGLGLLEPSFVLGLLGLGFLGLGFLFMGG